MTARASWLVLVACSSDARPADPPPVPVRAPVSGRGTSTGSAAVAVPAGGNTLRGTLIVHDQPLAYVALELCGDREGDLLESTRCPRSPRRRLTRTDADGDFAFTGLADGKYQIFPLERAYVTETLVVEVTGGHVRDLGRYAMRYEPVPAAPRGRNLVSGTIVYGDAPLAHVGLALCAGHDENIFAAPCLTPATRADANGAFRFADLADGSYQLFVLELPYYTHTTTFVEVAGGAVREVGRIVAHSTADLPH